jgi:hypothetical protein
MTPFEKSRILRDYYASASLLACVKSALASLCSLQEELADVEADLESAAAARRQCRARQGALQPARVTSHRAPFG